MLIKELEEEVAEKNKEIKRLRAGWSDSEDTVTGTGLRNTMSWRSKDNKGLKERVEEMEQQDAEFKKLKEESDERNLGRLRTAMAMLGLKADVGERDEAIESLNKN